MALFLKGFADKIIFMANILDFETKTCLKEDIPAVIAFTRRMKEEHGVGFLPQEEEALLSKYQKQDPQATQLNLFMLRDTHKRIVGCTGYIPFKGLFKSKLVNGFIADDAFIDPVARQSLPGLVLLLARSYETLIRKDKMLALACPVSAQTANNFKRVQWASFCWIYRFHHTSIAGISPEIDSRISIKKIEFFDDSLNRFFVKINKQHDFMLNSDVDFLNWKYFNKSFSDNTVLMAEIDGEMVGYMVFRQKDCDIHIVDISVDLDYPEAILILMHEGFNFCSERQVCITFVYASHQGYIDVLRKAGFSCCLEVECLFFKVGLVLYSRLDQADLVSSDRARYHFNGYAS